VTGGHRRSGLTSDTLSSRASDHRLSPAADARSTAELVGS
jgi:hypothetical protein